MANHKYSHALVLSHYQDSGLLSHDHRRRTPTRSAHPSRPRTTESRVISEVFSPFNSPLTSAAGHDSYFEKKRTQPPEFAHPNPATSRVLSSQPSLDRSDSIVTQIHVPARPTSPSQEVQYTNRLPINEQSAALRSSSLNTVDGRRSTRISHEGSKPPALRQKRVELHNSGSSNHRARPVHRDQLVQGPSYDTEDDSELDGPVRSSHHGQATARQWQQASSTRPESNDRFYVPYDPDPRPNVMPDTSVKPVHTVGQKPSPWSRVPGPPLDSAAIDRPRRPSYDQTLVQETAGEAATRSTSFDLRGSSYFRTQGTPQSTPTLPISLPRPSTAVDVRTRRPGRMDISNVQSDKTSGRPDDFAPRKRSQSMEQWLPTSPGEPSSPRHPAPLNVRVKPDHGEQSAEKPLPNLPNYPYADPKVRPLRYRTRGFASASRNSWTSRSSSRQGNTTETQGELTRNMAPPPEPSIRAEAANQAAGQNRAQRHTNIHDGENLAKDQVSAKEPQYNEANTVIPSPKAAAVSTSRSNDHRKPLSKFSTLPSNSGFSSLPSTNNPSEPSSLSSAGNSSNHPSTQTTPPTSPSLASLFSFSSTLSAPGQFSKIPIYNKDMIVLPWDHDLKMGPSIFCTSPPPQLSPPSPGSSIDDATPPPISRVRPLETRKRKTSETKARPRSLSGPSSTRLASPPPSIPTKQQQQPPYQQHQIPPPQQQIPPPQQQQHSRPRLSFSTTRAPISQLNSIPYAATTAGLPPIPTAEKVFVPPPREDLVMDRKEKEVERRRPRYFWQGGVGVGVREIFGLGRKGARPDAGFMRGIVGG